MPPSNPIGGSPQSRDVTVKLKVTADTAQGSKAVEDLKRQTERLGKATLDARREMDRLHNPNTRGGNYPDQNQPGFFGGGNGLAAVAVAAERTLNSLGNAIQAFSNKVGTTTQKLGSAIDAFFEGIPIASSIYGLGKGIGQAIQGYNTADAQRNLEATQRRLAIQGALSGPMLQRDQRLRDLELMRLGANTDLATFYARREGYFGQFTKAPSQLSQFLKESGNSLYDNYLTQQALGYTSTIGSPLLQAGGAALDFLTGAKRGLQDPRITNAEFARDALAEQMKRPRAELDALRETERGLGAQRKLILADLAMLQKGPTPSMPQEPPNQTGSDNPLVKRHAAIGRQFYLEQFDRYGGPKVGPNEPIPFPGPGIQPQDRARNELEIERKGAELLDKNKELEKAITDIRDKRLSIADRQNNLDKANIDVLKTQRQIAEETRSRLIGSATSLGLMSADQKNDLLYNIRLAKERGFANISEEQRNFLASNDISGPYARREAYRIGQNDPVFAEIQKLIGEPALDRVTEDLKKFNQQIAQADAEREEKLRKTIKQTTDEFTTKVAAIIIETFNQSAEDIKRKVQQGKTANTPST